MNYMREALRLAEYGRYSVAPNPLVGCVIEKNGVIVGQGWHEKAGEAHAEIIALNAAGQKAFGANVYLTLEPCCHYGKTPPCVDALIAAKVKSVHIPFADPNPIVNGTSITKLKAVNIDVYIGENADAARKQNEIFFHYITTKRPYVVAKWAMTADGKIATATGDSKWITSINARKHSHYSRCWLGSVLVGAGTVIKDDPNLTPYLLEDANESFKIPIRIILDSQGRIPLRAKVFASNSFAPTLVITTEKSSSDYRDSLLKRNIKILLLPTNASGINLSNLLDELGKMGISGILVEGGSKILTSFYKEKLVNKTHVYMAPKLIGGYKSSLADLDISDMTQSLNMVYENYEMLGDDIFVSAINTYDGIK